MDLVHGLFKSVFQSVSAFCNAGFDLIGSQSMAPFVTSRVVNITCMVLTTIGGLGFLVWDNISNCINEGIKKRLNFRKVIQKLSLHTKLVIIMQVLLVIIGTITFMSFEYYNLDTIGNYNLQDKILISSFHSVSARTAGFATVQMSNLNDITKIVLSILMFIGAGSGSMAGGIKTTTFLVIFLGVYSNIIGKKNINIFKRTITKGTFIKAVSVAFIAILVIIASNMFLIVNTNNIDGIDLLFESISAFATVGLTSGALALMNKICLLLIIFLMYIGRIGTITMAVAFVMKKPKVNDVVIYAKEDVIVG